MKTEIGGTFKWSTDQIGAYAAAFREGDAVKVDGKWVQVSKRKSDGIHYAIDGLNPFLINYHQEGSLAIGISHGFSEERTKAPYEVVTPKDYRVKEGDKIVWLRDTVKQGCRNEFTFGKAYNVFRSDDGYLVYKNDVAIELLASYLKDKGGMWGVIPRYENMKEEEGMSEKTESVDVIEYSGKFKAGDRVRVKAVAFDIKESCIGEFGVVSWIDDSGTDEPYGVSFEPSDFDYFNEAELELIERAEEKEEEEMNKKDECVGKFKKGDRVKVTGGGYKGSEGVVTQSDELNGKLSCAVLLDDGCGGRWFAEEYLELVKEEEMSVKQAEQEAFEYLLALDKTLVRIFLTDEINDWTKEYMRQKDYGSAKRAIEILEKLEKGE